MNYSYNTSAVTSNSTMYATSNIYHTRYDAVDYVSFETMMENVARRTARSEIEKFIKDVSDENLVVDADAFKRYAEQIMGTQAN